VPKTAVVAQGDRSVVFVLHDDTAERRAITTGEAEGDLVLTSAGIAAGERVIVDPPATLADGARVKVTAP
jgi:molybdopterin biosynthesis enzyme